MKSPLIPHKESAESLREGSADQVLRQLTTFSCEGNETGMRRSVCSKQSQCLFNEVQCFTVMQVGLSVRT